MTIRKAVDECARITYRAAKLKKWITKTQRPRPHAHPTRKKSVWRAVLGEQWCIAGRQTLKETYTHQLYYALVETNSWAHWCTVVQLGNLLENATLSGVLSRTSWKIWFLTYSRITMKLVRTTHGVLVFFSDSSDGAKHTMFGHPTRITVGLVTPKCRFYSNLRKTVKITRLSQS